MRRLHRLGTGRGDAEITQRDVALPVDEHVRRLEVAVDDALRVEVGQR